MKRTRKTVTRAVKKDVLDEHGWRCYSCGIEIKTMSDCDIDHILCVRDGGKDEMKNYTPLCVRCHNTKTAIERASGNAEIPNLEYIPYEKSYISAINHFCDQIRTLINRYTPPTADCYNKRMKDLADMESWLRGERE